MHPRRYERSRRSRPGRASAADLDERHPLLSLHWADAGERTWTSVRVLSGVPVVSVEGALSATSARPLREAVDAVVRMRPVRCVIDLSQVRDTDDTSVRLLVAVRRFALWHGVALSLAGLSTPAQHRLEAAALDPPFVVHPSVDRAVSGPPSGGIPTDPLRSAGRRS